DIVQIIDGASERTMNEAPPEIDLTEDAEIASNNSIRSKQAAKIIDSSTEQLVQKQQKEQSDLLSEEIRKRFATLKKVNKENFNMFEVAITCHKLANDYKKLAKLNHWKEIEAMFD
ncbi:MAG: hypothetical protein SFU98_23150, partial [Leptospiraceae bacterium]|nr:hypothetical protein [Leptospiraceae bacterium]